MITWNPFKLLDGDPEKEPAAPIYTGPSRDPFDAVPVRNKLAEARMDSKSRYQIRMRIPPTRGTMARIAARLGYHRDVRIDLDEHGSFYWSLIDGIQNLHAIEKAIRARFDLQRDESRTVTLTFTKMLMLRQLIQLDLRGSEGRPPEGAASGQTMETQSHAR